MTKSASIQDLPIRPSAARILPAVDAAAWQDGFGFLEIARREADRLRKAAQRGYAREYALGYKDGKAQGAEEAARLVSDAAIKVDHYLSRLENEVISLTLDIVRRVLGEFDLNELVAKAARQAVGDIRRVKYLRVCVHPNAEAAVRQELGVILRGSDLGLTVEVVTDNTLDDSACIVFSDIAVVDASIDAQLEAIAAALKARAEANS